MIRGTTPAITYKISYGLDFATIEEAWITVKQETKHKSVENTYKYTEGRVTLDPVTRRISAVLTQEDTLSYDMGSVEVQLRLLADNKAMATKARIISMDKILKEGEISG